MDSRLSGSCRGNKLRDMAFENGVAILGSGNKSIRFRPPLIINKEQIDEAVKVLDTCLSKM